MKRIEASSFSGPRAYFTAFDHRLVSRHGDLAGLKKSVERRLKLLLLLKSRIVCAASHLVSEVATEIFRKSPRLLSEGHVVPALRRDKDTFLDAFPAPLRPASGETARFYEDIVSEAVNWDLVENSKWFRDQFVREVEDEGTLIRSQLDALDGNVAKELLDKMRDVETLHRGVAEEIVRSQPSKVQIIVLTFQELLYHLSGSRVVNAEGALPQEEYLDFDLADLTQQRTRLSEDEVFAKVFLECALDAMQAEMIPVEVLDILNFDDVLLLRQPILNSLFQEDYDRLLRLTVSSSGKARKGMLFDVAQLDILRIKLSEAFGEIFQKEIPEFLKRKHLKATNKVLWSGSSIALGLAGYFPIPGNPLSAAGLLKDFSSFYVNLVNFVNSAEGKSDLDRYTANKRRLLKQSIESREIDDRSVLIDTVDLLTSTIAEKLKI